MNDLQKNVAVSVGRVLRDVGAINNLPKEEIDGYTPEDAARLVDLSIGYTPVVLDRWIDYWDIVRPVRVQTDGGRYCAVWPNHHDFQILSDRQHREARARFLLIRGYFYKNLGQYSYPEQRKIIAWYFQGGVWRPDPESTIGKAMGLR